MYFTLIPVAALLLMLVGVGMPAHAAVPGQTAESRMRALLGLEAGSDADAHPIADELRAERTARITAERSAPVHGRASRSAFACQVRAHAEHAVAAPGAFAAKQYRTRFGVAGGAYLAAGPPAIAA